MSSLNSGGKELSPPLNRFIHSPLHLETNTQMLNGELLIDISESVFINIEREKESKLDSFNEKEENQNDDEKEQEIFYIKLDSLSSGKEIIAETENLNVKENIWKQKYEISKRSSQVDKYQKDNDNSTIFKSNQYLDYLLSPFLNESIINSPNEHSSLFQLPTDTIHIILEFFDISSILNFEITCRDAFYHINCDYNNFERGFWSKYSLNTLKRHADISTDEFLNFAHHTLKTDNFRDAFLATGILELPRLKRYLESMEELERDDFHGIFTFRKLSQTHVEKIILTHFESCNMNDHDGCYDEAEDCCSVALAFYDIYDVNPEDRLNIKKYLLAPVQIRNMETQNEENQIELGPEQTIRNILKKPLVQVYVQWLQGISEELETILPTLQSCSKSEQNASVLNRMAQALYYAEQMNKYIRDSEPYTDPFNLLALHLAFLDPQAVSRVRFQLHSNNDGSSTIRMPELNFTMILQKLYSFGFHWHISDFFAEMYDDEMQIESRHKEMAQLFLEHSSFAWNMIEFFKEMIKFGKDENVLAIIDMNQEEFEKQISKYIEWIHSVSPIEKSPCPSKAIDTLFRFHLLQSQNFSQFCNKTGRDISHQFYCH